jgi:hypothetical protein
MANPKIARRCPVCGASIRETASFCPQCGQEVHAQNAEGKPRSVPTTPLEDLAPGKGKEKREGRRAETGDATLRPPAGAEGASQKPAPDQAAAGKVREKIQRATHKARDVEGDMIHRVQKVRQISSVVLDEAGYDPSLRFVLVAAALFVLFLLVLLLNKLIG